MAGYSATPLPQKLGIKPEARFHVSGAPGDFAATLGGLPPGATRMPTLRRPLDVVIAFFTERDRLQKAWPKLTAAAQPDGTVWIAWPKRASGIATDITEDVLREVLLPTGWVDNKVCAIDDTWSGLRFALRRELR